MVRDKRMADKRVILSMPEDLRERVSDYRFGAKIPTEAEAIRTLLQYALDQLLPIAKKP